MNVLVIDFETTGVDPKVCRPIEVAYKIFTPNFSAELKENTSLIYADNYPDISPEVEELTGISKNALLAHGKAPDVVFKDIAKDVDIYDVAYIIAYNREFDENVYKEECKRLGWQSGPENVKYVKPAILPWLCAMRDVRSNLKHKCWKLSHLALEYGITVDPKTLHRAMADVDLTVQILIAAGVSAKDLYDYQKKPRYVLEAICKPPWKDGGESTTKAKEKGYAWESPKGHPNMRFAKRWVKVVLEDELASSMEELAFQVRKVHV